MQQSLRRGFVALSVAYGLLLSPLVAPGAAAEPAKVEVPVKLGTVEGITEYKLANGLRVLLLPDASKPVVTVNLTIFVGSRHEGYGETGMAHLLEHLLFKGTPTYPNIPKALRDHGASNFNGTTWVDRTNYYETLPATDENLEFGIAMEADRMVNSNVKREDLISEMTVVRNEFEMGENSPESILSQRMMASAYEWHNYGKSTIGNRADIERVPIENLQAFYRRYYRSDNAMLVVAGKFAEAKALDHIVKYFGTIKKPTDPLRGDYTEEPAQDGERFVNLRRVGTVGAAGLVYHVPAGSHPDYAAIEILEDALTAAPSGRLYKALIEGKKASSVRGSVYPWHDPGVIELVAKVEGKSSEVVRDLMIETVENLAKNPIADAEVDRSKVRYQKLVEQVLSSTDQFAIQLSEWAAAGDWRLFFLHRDRIEKVTAADVNRVAKQYLTRNNRTVGVYIPSEKADRAEIPASPKVAEMVKDYKGRAAVSSGEAFEPTPENLDKRVARGKLGGLSTAVLTKKTRGEVVHLQMIVRFGNETSLAGLNTPAEMLGAMLRRGTTKSTREQLSDKLDKLGAQLRLSSDTGNLTVGLEVKRGNLPEALSLVGEILREPSFPQAEFDILKRETLERLNSSKTEPQALAAARLRQTVSQYPKGDVRYVATIDEKIAEVQATTLESVKELYLKQLSAQAGELAIVGDFDAPATLKQIGVSLDGWVSPTKYARIVREASKVVKAGRQVIDTPDKANAVYIGGTVVAMKDTDADYPAMLLANYLLGEAPLASRLSNRVRGEEGLSYGIGSNFGAGTLDPLGRFIVFAITNPKNMEKVDKIIEEEIAKFIKDGASASEVNEGRDALVKKMQVGRASDRALVGELAGYLQNGRTYAYDSELEKKIGELTPDQVTAAFRKIIDPKKLVIIQAGDFKKK